ncbi:hypothetical protein LWI29_019705 [Acer saccharum]|uniref:Retrovirus-related Pol polyprotein from transposon TNT 1-94 n=1 Tax=Acer saccharum TaxID=4024 RepID=A0AA39VRI9_ACESA|nr:hypothetical protein LWI29_019705 [Acer saccharum]
MDDAKSVRTPLASHFRLSKDQSLKTEEEKDFMAKVPYASAIGSLMYVMTCTRPDISHAMGVVSRYMSNPNFAGEVDHRRSTTRYVLTMASTAISWMSQLQKIVTISTTEAEYVVVTESNKELIWLQSLLTELGFD